MPGYQGSLSPHRQFLSDASLSLVERLVAMTLSIAVPGMTRHRRTMDQIGSALPTCSAKTVGEKEAVAYLMENKNGFLSVVLGGTKPGPTHWRQQSQRPRIRPTKIEHIWKLCGSRSGVVKGLGAVRSYREISYLRKLEVALTLLVDGSYLSYRNCAKVPEN